MMFCSWTFPRRDSAGLGVDLTVVYPSGNQQLTEEAIDLPLLTQRFLFLMNVTHEPDCS